MAKKTADGMPRKCVLTIKITAAEHDELAAFAKERCVNISALVRKLLFEQLRKERS